MCLSHGPQVGIPLPLYTLWWVSFSRCTPYGGYLPVPAPKVGIFPFLLLREKQGGKVRETRYREYLCTRNVNISQPFRNCQQTPRGGENTLGYSSCPAHSPHYSPV